MSAVAITIVVCLGLYTFLRWHYAKPGKPHEPYAEDRTRVEHSRIAAAGWNHFEAAFEPLADLPSPRGNVRARPQRPAVVDTLAQSTTGAWILPIEYTEITAPAALAPMQSYTVHFQARLDRPRAQIVGFDVYAKGEYLIAIPRWEPVPDGLVPRDQPTVGRMFWPEGAVAPGHYHVTLPAIKESSEWDLEVTPK